MCGEQEKLIIKNKNTNIIITFSERSVEAIEQFNEMLNQIAAFISVELQNDDTLSA
ncbi:hypothetical protein [Thermaerobacillus caldiproteolyticus]|uniref:Uncharacterized protein n=1 Tax=Thermaerobacillus caldiproteolyticus TaxID=247480 RepID=A0A7V9Z861_9BACL|nr:hypothetical protein [Anoxybacillus caldiproteolyticus]MBA2875825.1 hypothetical protein [Anoxybacillus caldiproteolyticus]